MTPEQREEQRRSFAFGNCAMDDPRVTREMVDRAAASLKYREGIIRQIDENQEFSELDDGFLYYFPSKSGGGFSAHLLRTIADELDKRNEEWNRQIERYFAEHPPTESAAIEGCE